MQVRNIGAYITGRFCAAEADALAAGTGDATETSGAYIDRQGFHSAKVMVFYTATLAEDKTLSIASNLQDASASDGTGVADYGAVYANAVVATGDTGGSTETGVIEYDIDFLGGTQGAADGTVANRYIRIQFTPDLSATGTDTAKLYGVVILGGAEDVPAS